MRITDKITVLVNTIKENIENFYIKWAQRQVDIFNPVTIKEFMNNDKEHTVIDIREKSDWEKGHIPGAVCIPYHTIKKEFPKLDLERDDLIVVYSYTGKRSAIAALKLQKIGYRVVSTLEGGFPSWQAEGFQIQTPTPQRQKTIRPVDNPHLRG